MSADVVRFMKAMFTDNDPMTIAERVTLFDSMSEEDRDIVRKLLSEVMLKHTEKLATKIVKFSRNEEP
jgi:hypothetical protein